MDMEGHVKLVIGDLVLTIAKQAAELDALKAAQPVAPVASSAEPSKPANDAS